MRITFTFNFVLPIESRFAKFLSVSQKYHATCHMEEMVKMDQALGQIDSRKSNNNVKDTMTARNCGVRLNKCNQCEFASSHASALRSHFKTHNGEKPNKCDKCEYASSQVSNLRRHLKTHSGEKPNKCSQCDFAGRRFGETFENAQWRKVLQIRPM